MPLANDNPYSASQILHEKNFSSYWRSLLYRASIGLLVGTTVLVLVHLLGPEEKKGIDIFLFSMCVSVTTASTFTQSETAKKNGRTGIISAIMLWLASLVIASLLTHAITKSPPHLKGHEKEWAEYHEHYQKQNLFTWVFLYAGLVGGYFFFLQKSIASYRFE